MLERKIKRFSLVCILIATGLASVWSARASSDGRNEGEKSLVVVLDRDVYRQRELYLLEDAVSEATSSRLNRTYIRTENGAIDLLIQDMDDDRELAGTIEKFGTQQEMSVVTTPAKSFSIDFARNQTDKSGVERLHPDTSYLERSVDDLRPTLRGVTITQDTRGAIVKWSDPAIGKAIGARLKDIFVITPLTTTSLHVSWDMSRLSTELPPAQLRIARSQTAEALRELLADPIELQVYRNDAGVRFDVRDPDHHFQFVQAVERAFEKNPRFVIHETKALDIRLSAANLKSYSTLELSNESKLPFPQPIFSKEYSNAMDKLQELINPPNIIRTDGNAVLIRARDAGRNGELSSIVRQALATRTDLLLKTLPDESLQIELARDAHRGQGAATLTAKRFVDGVKTYLDSAKLTPSGITPLGPESARIDFASSIDAAAFRASLSKAASLTINLVDEASPEDSPTAPSVGDEKLRLPTGKHIWVHPSPIVTGDMIADTTVGKSKLTDEPMIELRLTNEGGDRLAVATRKYVGQRMAIAINDEALEVPVIETPIQGGSMEITGNLTEESAKALVQSILPFRANLPLRIVETR